MTIRTMLRSCYLSVVGTFKRPSPYVHILNGHMVDWKHDNDSDGEQFGKLLAEMHKYCDFVNFEDAVRMILNGEKVTRPKIAFSFDVFPLIWQLYTFKIPPSKLLKMVALLILFFISQ